MSEQKTPYGKPEPESPYQELQRKCDSDPSNEFLWNVLVSWTKDRAALGEVGYYQDRKSL